jgi:hypothetical protein
MGIAERFRAARIFVVVAYPPSRRPNGSDPEVTHVRRNGGKRAVSRHCWGQSRPVIPNSIATERLDEARLGCRQHLRQHREVRAAGGTDLQRCVHVDAHHVAAWREPQLALAGEQHVPGLVLLPADQGMLAVGAEPSVGSWLASGAGQAFVGAGSAVLGPSTRLEVPAAEGPDAFFAAFSSTWRSVNSWKKRSPTG